jgi:hypothetical protein
MRAAQNWMNRITPPEDDALARALVAALLAGDYGFVMANMDERALGETPEATLKELYEYIDHDAPQAIELVGCNIFRSGKRRKSSLTYQLEFPHSWCVAVLVIASDNSTRKAIGFRLQKLPASLAEINKFTLKGKTFAHFTVLLNMIGVPLFVVYALIKCIRTRIRRKWLWMLFILVGIGALELNWTTGQMRLEALSIQLLGASFLRQGFYGPWILGISFPLGAVMFLRRRRKLGATVRSVATEARGANEGQSGMAGDGFEAGGEGKAALGEESAAETRRG